MAEEFIARKGYDISHTSVVLGRRILRENVIPYVKMAYRRMVHTVGRYTMTSTMYDSRAWIHDDTSEGVAE